MTLRLAPLATLLALLTAPAVAAAEAPDPSFVHAHRGAHTIAGEFRFGEETLSAFRQAHEGLGSVLELDAKLTRDKVPVVFHDDTLDRTTPCVGDLRTRRLAQLDNCPVDVLGSPGGSLGGVPTTATEPIPTLEQALEYARDAGATVNLEIKNVPTDSDFDDTDAYANAVMDVVVESGFPADRLIVQSYWPPNLDVAKERLPGVQTAFLTLTSLNHAGPGAAASNGYDWVSPEWPVDADYVEQAHSAGRKVVPYTLNTPADVLAAYQAGVDAVITDDPLMARRALGIPDPGTGDTTGPVVTLRTREATWRKNRSRVIDLRWTGTDPDGLAGYEAQIRRLGATRWRMVSRGGRPAIDFKAKAGRVYELRVRAQDDRGNLGEYTVGRLTVPIDERHRVIRLDRDARRVKRRSAWNGRLAIARRRGAIARTRLTCARVRVIGPLLRRGGRLAVTIDGERETVSVRGRGVRRTLFDSGTLDVGRHRISVRSLGGGPVALDALACS